MTSGKVLYAASTFRHLRSFHLPYLAWLVQHGWQVTAAAAEEPEGMPEGVECLVLPFEKSFTSPRNLAAARKVAQALRRDQYDLVFTHTSLAAFFTRLGVAMAGKGQTRVVNMVHGYLFDGASSPARRAALLGAEKLVAPVTDRVVVMNHQDLDIAQRHRLGHEEPVFVPGLGIDPGCVCVLEPASRVAARNELGIPRDAFVLLCAAEFSERKNQRLLIEGLAQLPENVVLALPGTGDLLQECRKLADDMGLGKRVLTPGFQDNLHFWRTAADLCVSASRYEGLPFHVMESMAMGIPAVLSRIKGHEDLVEGLPMPDALAGGAGLLFAYDDAAEFAQQVRTLMEDPNLLAACGTCARSRAGVLTLPAVMPSVLHACGFESVAG